LAERALLEIEEQGILADNGIICAETGAKESLPEKVGILQRIDQRRYGSIMINFYAQDKE
jgi:16S rRNA G966 N2-methylase RsmD